jgi:DNA helicase-2/ATP-dependent DNA helicase PcrA
MAHADCLHRTKRGIDFEAELNPEQLEAVMTLEGPVLVIAGAGSGKTRTLVYRVARLIDIGVEPTSIVLLTFTRKAAATMLSRASELVGPACGQVAGGTFHGFAHGMLRRYAGLLGFPSAFTVLDRSDVQGLLRLLAGRLDLTGSGRRFPGKAAVASIFSKVANCEGGISGVLEKGFPHLLSEKEGLERLFSAYSDYKREHALMDYDDLLLKWRDILVRFGHVREAMGARFRYIMVDEYQDTNATQADIVRLTATGHENVMVVGDDAQSIYSFRGANFKNILEFPRIFPGARLIKLEKNYRSTQPNLDCTNAIITHAREKFAKRLVAQRQGGGPPVLYRARDELDQARFVRGRIQGLVAEGIKPAEIAVLFRAGFHSFQLETELNAHGMGFVKRGGLRLTEVAHIKDLLFLLRLLVNPLDHLSWSRVLPLLEHLGPKSADKIFSRLIKSDDPLECLAAYETRARWRDAVRGLGRHLATLRDASLDLPEVLSELEAWYRPHLERLYPADYPKRLQELAHLRGIATLYPDAVSLLADLALDPPEQADAQGKVPGRLVLSTVHSAKGLEWKVVFVISLSEGRFPSPASLRRTEDIEEERRLFYVAATRAKDRLFFCYPELISVSGTGMIPARPSRFLEEIPSNLMRLETVGLGTWDEFRQDDAACGPERRNAGVFGPRPEGSRDRSPGTGNDAQAGFRPGARVRHPVFGPGQVVETLGVEKVRVLFDVAGEKTMHLQYAKLSLIG